VGSVRIAPDAENPFSDPSPHASRVPCRTSKGLDPGPVSTGLFPPSPNACSCRRVVRVCVPTRVRWCRLPR